jgi:HAE1 family hydrophobic/amphiphilic exporter-1
LKVNPFHQLDLCLLTWSLDHYKTTLAIVLVVFFSSIALVPAGFIGGEFFAASDSGFLVQIEMPKDASLEQTNFMTQKSRSLFRQRRFCSQSIYYCGSN